MIKQLIWLYRLVSRKYQTIHLDYSVVPKPRYSVETSAHSRLYEIIDLNRRNYENEINSLLSFLPGLATVKRTSEVKHDLTWENGFFPPLDTFVLYGVISNYKPQRYIEVGSGNSTKIVRRAINDQGLDTQIISVDPKPRAEIDSIADEILRQRLENLIDSNFITDSLGENDILFIDNSHRVLPNSDAMVFFMEILPYLKKGVIVHVHDIYLPFDYPQFMCDRYYNEQYLLAAFLLSNPTRFEILMPNYFISSDDSLSKLISPLWMISGHDKSEKHGGSFWFRVV